MAAGNAGPRHQLGRAWKLQSYKKSSPTSRRRVPKCLLYAAENKRPHKSLRQCPQRQLPFTIVPKWKRPQVHRLMAKYNVGCRRGILSRDVMLEGVTDTRCSVREP